MRNLNSVSNQKSERIKRHGAGKTSLFIGTIAFCLVLMLSFVSCSDESSFLASGDILDKLRSIEGADVLEIQPYYGYERAFRIDFVQPVDHDNPSGQHFTQRMYLSHTDENQPMVFAPSGYAATERSGQEIAGILQTNCLNVTHRYFTDSKPAPLDWQYLTIRQSAADHHRIVEAFKSIYPGPWVSSGASKSGMTPLYHNRFYPDDVDAVIAYVSPFMFSTADGRFSTYLNNTGTAEDWTRIKNFQKMVLEKRDDLLDPFQAWFHANGYRYSGNPDAGIESAILSYDWSFHQRYIFETSEIPGEDATAETIVDHLAEVVRLYSMSDEWRGYFDPYFYQAFRELGYPTRDYSHLNALLRFEHPNPGEAFGRQEGIEIVYNPDTILDIHQWCLTEGNNVIYIYGSIDPWSGGAIQLTGGTNAIWIMHPGGDHSTKIEDLPEQDLVLNTLSQWLGIDITTAMDRGIKVGKDAQQEQVDFMLIR